MNRGVGTIISIVGGVLIGVVIIGALGYLFLSSKKPESFSTVVEGHPLSAIESSIALSSSDVSLILRNERNEPYHDVVLFVLYSDDGTSQTRELELAADPFEMVSVVIPYTFLTDKKIEEIEIISNKNTYIAGPRVKISAVAYEQCGPDCDPTFIPQAITPEFGSPISAQTQMRAEAKEDVRFSPPPSLPFYSVGNWSDEEQLYLEYINRARNNSAAEAQLMFSTTDSQVIASMNYFGVDRNVMRQQISSLFSPVQPVAPNAQLLQAARKHALDMYNRNFQGHIGSDGSTQWTRVSNTGYNWNTVGENAFATAQSVFHGHAGYEVDWGGGPYGMQTPPGHRLIIHSNNYKEVGIGVVNGKRLNVGPQLNVEDFANRWGLGTIVTGVVYHDYNSNNFYDLGEGIDNFLITSSNASMWTLTAYSGGYALPLDSAKIFPSGNVTVVLELPRGQSVQTTAPYLWPTNIKIDFKLSYTPPVARGPSSVEIGQPTVFRFDKITTANSHLWESYRLIPKSIFEGAENGLVNIIALNMSYTDLSRGYPVIVNTPVVSGMYAFHLVHPSPDNQYVLLNYTFIPSEQSVLNFSRRLGWATAAQTARAEISNDAGKTWTTLWSKTGDSTAGETLYTSTQISLAPYVGQQLKLRFSYDYTGGSYYSQTGEGMGFYIDNINVTNVLEMEKESAGETLTSAFYFTSTTDRRYGIRIQGKTAQRVLPWGPLLIVNSSVEIGDQSIYEDDEYYCEDSDGGINPTVAGDVQTLGNVTTTPYVSSGFGLSHIEMIRNADYCETHYPGVAFALGSEPGGYWYVREYYCDPIADTGDWVKHVDITCAGGGDGCSNGACTAIGSY